MFGGSSYGGTTYGGTSSTGNLYSASLSDSITLTSTIANMITLLRTLTDSIAATDTISHILTIARSYSDGLTLVDAGLSKVYGRLLSSTITLSDTIRRYLNGLLVNPWTKVAEAIATFVKLVKPTASYTKSEKLGTTGIWTKNEKPY